MASITIVSGAPGTGKTTVAAHLAKAVPRGVHMPTDVFYGFPAAPIPPHLPAAHAQNTTIISAMMRAAVAFAAGGYAVFLDGIIGPWFLPHVATELSGVQNVHYVVLRAPLAICLRRVHERADGSDEGVVRKMHAELTDLGPYAPHAVDTLDLSAADVAAEVARRIQCGDLRLDVG